MEREIIRIDEEKCTGCGLCVPNCHEGALKIIDGKARLISDLMCDGLGACLGHCPEGAITIEKREAEPYDEKAVIQIMVRQGANTVREHLKHLRDHGETGFLNEATDWLRENAQELPFNISEVIGSSEQKVAANEFRLHHHGGASCPGSAERIMATPAFTTTGDRDGSPSQLTHWPVQMHLINPLSQVYKGSDLLLAADCVAFSLGSFHNSYLKGKTLAIACPKLDHNTEVYVQKLTALIDQAGVNTITVMVMEVPCCGGLIQLVKQASMNARRKVPVKKLMVSIEGKILVDEWI